VNTEPYGTTNFCDDIRHEVNGKLTLVGCYSSSLKFDGQAPGVLPTFAALVNLRVPNSIKFSNISLRVTKIEEDEETTILEASIENPGEHNEAAFKSTADANEEGIVALVTLPIHLKSLHFSKPGQIKVRAYLDDDREIRLGVLSVEFTEEPPEDRLKGQ
jgi:hypothetical protein